MSKVMQYQSLLDLAIQETGVLESVFEIAIQNGISLTDTLVSGSEIVIKAIEGDRKIKAYYKSKGIKPATGVIDGLILEGIDYWAVELDNVVQ